MIEEERGDLLVGSNTQLLEHPFEEAKYLCTGKLLDSIRNTIPKEVSSMVDLSFYKYFANLRFEKEDMTEAEFEYYFSLIQDFKNHEAYTLYPYYCPGYGVEIDVLPNGLDKARGVQRVNEVFYRNLPKENVALSIFNGDFSQIDLRMVDCSLTNDVLFVGSEEADIKPYVENTELKYRTVGHKIETITMAMEEVLTTDLEKHPYDKGNYRYVK